MAPNTPKTPVEKPARPARAARADKPGKTANAATKPAPVRAPKVATPVKASADKPARAARLAAKAAAKPAGGAAVVKLRDLIDTVATATGTKKPEAKKTVEAVLAAIGESLAAKSTLALPPLGKLRVVKANAGVLTLKLRLADATRGKGMALADDDEES